MQKTKFTIKGMHCQSCATLIEERLKNKPGIIQTKVSYDSGIGVIIYDEKKIQEAQIKNEIEKVGEYQAEKIPEENSTKTEEENNQATAYNKKKLANSPKILFSLGFLVSFSLISLILNLVLLNKLGANNLIADDSKNTNQEQNGLDNNSPPLPSKPAIAQFEITKDNHIRGDFEAPITLVEFSDFECPFCERFYPTVKKLLEDYQGKVRLVYKHFPLGFHPNAQKAAEASECADEQNKFWAYHDKLFENQPQGYSLDKFKQLAKDLGLNSGDFNACLDSGKYAQKVQDDYQEGGAKGVNGTPGTFVNGQLVSGALPYETFKQIIDSLLNQ